MYVEDIRELFYYVFQWFNCNYAFKEIPKDVKLLDVNFPLPGTIDIFTDRLLIIDWKTIIGILITSSEIADIFVNYFDSIWRIAHKWLYEIALSNV